MKHRSPLSQTFLILTLGACGMTTLLALLPAAGHDQMWLLYAAGLMLHGAQPYGPQIFETNPPLILWLSAVPAALAPILHLPDTAIGKLLVLLLELATATLCVRLLSQPKLRGSQVPTVSSSTLGLLTPPPASETWGTPALYILLFAYITAVAVLPARDFGQRDHLLTLFLLPYLAAAASRAANLPIPRPLAYLTGTLALLGLALKPHQLLIPLAVELWLLLQPDPQTPATPVSLPGNPGSTSPPPSTPELLLAGAPGSTAPPATLGVLPPPLTRLQRLRRLRRPELQALFLTGLLFLLAVRLFTPLYFTTVVPLARDTYWAYGGLPPLQLLTQSIQLHILLLLNLVLFARKPRHTAPLTRTLLIAGLAATLAFYLQGTGWYYQQLPALTYLTLALPLQLLATWEKKTPVGAPGSDAVSSRPPWDYSLDIATLPRWTIPAAATLTLLALALTTHFMNYPFTPARAFPIDQPDPAFFANLPPGAPVLTLSPTIDDTLQPVYKFHLTLAQRYPAFLLLPALLRSESGPNQAHHISPARLQALDLLQHTMMVGDLNRWHPILILVERCQDPTVHCQVLEDRHDDLLAFFLRDPAFARIFAHYHHLRTSGPYDAYTLN